MWLIDKLAERHIREAQARGELENLPGEGHPLDLQEEPLVPQELRAGYRLLKNAGYLPPQLQLQREIRDVEELLRLTTEPGERRRTEQRLALLQLRLAEGRQGMGIDLRREAEYRERLLQVMEKE